VSQKKRIAVIAGDGIGGEVIPEAVRAIAATGAPKSVFLLPRCELFKSFRTKPKMNPVRRTINPSCLLPIVYYCLSMKASDRAGVTKKVQLLTEL